MVRNGLKKPLSEQVGQVVAQMGWRIQETMEKNPNN